MLRAHGQPPKAEGSELLAHCAFVHIDLKPHFDFPLQINPSPADNPVGCEIRAGAHQGC